MRRRVSDLGNRVKRRGAQSRLHPRCVGLGLSAWCQTDFANDYLSAYVDIVSPERTRPQIDFLVRELRLWNEAKLLDLGCGHGRHAVGLAKYGFKVVGLDASCYLLRLAKILARTEEASVDFVRGDFGGLPFLGEFDAVICMFTSFGYCEMESGHSAIIAEVTKVLRPGGLFLIDLNNIASLRDRLFGASSTGSALVLQSPLRRRRLSNGISLSRMDEFDVKSSRWRSVRNWVVRGKPKQLDVDVRVFTLDEISRLLRRNGLEILSLWGDYDSAAFKTKSPRMILLARLSDEHH